MKDFSRLTIGVIAVGVGMLTACGSSNTSSSFTASEPIDVSSPGLECVSTHPDAPPLIRGDSGGGQIAEVNLDKALERVLASRGRALKRERVSVEGYWLSGDSAQFVVLDADNVRKGLIQFYKNAALWKDAALLLCNDVLVDPGEQLNEPRPD